MAPKLQNSNFVSRNVLGGWEVTGITQAESGNSFTIFQNGISENTGAIIDGAKASGNLSSLFQSGTVSMQRPLANQGCSSGGIKGDQVINPNATTLIGYHLGTIDPGTAPRGYCHGPHLINTDLSIDKNWKVRERFTVQLRIDAFDALNHANFRADQGNFTTAANVNCGASVQNPLADGGSRTAFSPCSATNNIVTSQTPGQNFGKSTSTVGNAGRQLQYGLHVEF